MKTDNNTAAADEKYRTAKSVLQWLYKVSIKSVLHINNISPWTQQFTYAQYTTNFRVNKALNWFVEINDSL